jgi:hypothetical protein
MIDRLIDKKIPQNQKSIYKTLPTLEACLDQPEEHALIITKVPTFPIEPIESSAPSTVSAC